MLAKRYNVVQMRQFFSSKSCVRLLSLPIRGEWIEMDDGGLDITYTYSLSPCGESGLKSVVRLNQSLTLTVSPHAGRVD